MNESTKTFVIGCLVTTYVVLGILINFEFITTSFWINQLCTWSGPLGFFLWGTMSTEPSSGHGVVGAFLMGLYVAYMIISPHANIEHIEEGLNTMLFMLMGCIVIIVSPILGAMCLGIECSEL